MKTNFKRKSVTLGNLELVNYVAPHEQVDNEDVIIIEGQASQGHAVLIHPSLALDPNLDQGVNHVMCLL